MLGTAFLRLNATLLFCSLSVVAQDAVPAAPLGLPVPAPPVLAPQVSLAPAAAPAPKAADVPKKAEAPPAESAPAAAVPEPSKGELSAELLGKLNLAAQHAKANQPAEAAAAYTEFLNARKDMFSPFLDRGKVYQTLKKHDLAIEDFSAALKLKADLLDAHMRRCVSYVETGQLVKAIEDCDRVIAAKPRGHEPHYYKGLAHGGLKEYDKAVASFDKAFEINNDLPDAHLVLAKMFTDADQLLSALRQYTIVIQQRPGHAEAYKLRAEIKAKLGDALGATDDLSKIKK